MRSGTSWGSISALPQYRVHEDHAMMFAGTLCQRAGVDSRASTVFDSRTEGEPRERWRRAMTRRTLLASFIIAPFASMFSRWERSEIQLTGRRATSALLPHVPCGLTRTKRAVLR